MADLPDLRVLWLITLRRPREAARAVLALNLPNGTLWLAAGTVATVGAIVSLVGQIILPATPDAPDILVRISPIGFALFALAALGVSSAVLTQMGRILGGVGRFNQVFAVMIWLQAVLVTLEVALLALMLLAPLLASFVALAVYVAALVWMVLFLEVAHCFNGPGRAIGALLMSLLAIGFILQFLFMAGGANL